MLILAFAATVERMSTSATSAGIVLASFVDKMTYLSIAVFKCDSFTLHSTQGKLMVHLSFGQVSEGT